MRARSMARSQLNDGVKEGVSACRSPACRRHPSPLSPTAATLYGVLRTVCLSFFLPSPFCGRACEATPLSPAALCTGTSSRGIGRRSLSQLPIPDRRRLGRRRAKRLRFRRPRCLVGMWSVTGLPPRGRSGMGLPSIQSIAKAHVPLQTDDTANVRASGASPTAAGHCHLIRPVLALPPWTANALPKTSPA